MLNIVHYHCLTLYTVFTQPTVGGSDAACGTALCGPFNVSVSCRFGVRQIGAYSPGPTIRYHEVAETLSISVRWLSVTSEKCVIAHNNQQALCSLSYMCRQA